MATILVISDSHINPDNVSDSVELWYRLGKYCAKTKPEVIVHLGDVADLSSQAWRVAARGKYSLEEETNAVHLVLDAFEEAIKEYNRKQRRKKKKIYKPVKILTLGNHDIRNGVTVIDDMFTDAGWDVIDYLQPINIRGINFCHCMRKGLTDMMCTTSEELLQDWGADIVVGHGHHKDFATSYSLAIHRPITALKCPAFTLGDYDWAAQTQYKWNRGFTEIEPGVFDALKFVWKDLACLYESL
jgi:predicted phosphodiesterase